MSQSGKFIAGTGAGGIETITGTSGGAVGPDGAFNVNLLGSGGVTVVGDAPTNTLTINVSGSGFVWNIETGDTGMTVDNGYVSNAGALVTFTLPATAAVGTSLAVAGLGAGGWRVAQNAGQVIHLGPVSSTTGAGGSVSSTNRYDSMEILCVVADTEWVVAPGSEKGTLTVV